MQHRSASNKPVSISLIKNAGEKKHEEIYRIANRVFSVGRIGSGKDELLPQLRTLSDLH